MHMRWDMADIYAFIELSHIQFFGLVCLFVIVY